MRKLIFWIVIAAILFLARPAQAQTTIIMTNNTLAFTYCESGVARVMIDAGIIGTDSLEEILIHEATHLAQSRDSTGACKLDLSIQDHLAGEVEAYCASRPARMKRGFTKEEVDDSYLRRLIVQFWHLLDIQTVIQSYPKGCLK